MDKILIYSALIFVSAFTGGILPLWVSPRGEKGLKLFVSLGAGLLLGMTFLHILPEVSERLPHLFGLYLLLGFLLLLIVERFIMVHACEETHCDYHTVGVSAFLGLTLHGVIEGLALGTSIIAADIGPLVFLGILSHKLPAGFALTSILKLAHKTKKKILLFTFGVALSVPTGCFLSLLIIKTVHLEKTAGILLSISAGTFLYISACDLLPELHRSNEEKMRRLLFFLIGILISSLSGLIFTHQH